MKNALKQTGNRNKYTIHLKSNIYFQNIRKNLA